MQAFSVWHWLVAVAVVFVPVWLLVRCRRRVDAGWLFLFALLCIGFMKSLVDLAQAMPDSLAGFQNVAARDPLATAGLVALVMMALYLWAIVTLFQDRKVFRAAHAALCGLALLIPFSLLVMLSGRGVTIATLFPDAGQAKAIATLFSVSVRGKNTLVG